MSIISKASWDDLSKETPEDDVSWLRGLSCTASRHEPFLKSSLSFSNSNDGLEIAHADNMTARENLENADFHLLISH